MWYIIISVIFLGIFAGVCGYYSDRRRQRMFEQGKMTPEDEPEVKTDPDCCGQHAVCERDSLIAAASKAIEYYDDEELDAYRGMPSDKYAEGAVEEFRDVLYTLQEAEVAGWIRSLQLRGINLPDTLKDEAFLIVGERRIG